MQVNYFEGEIGDIKKDKVNYTDDNLYVRIGEKIKLGTSLCEVVDIVHYPRELGGYTVNVFVKVIKELPGTFWEEAIYESISGIFKKIKK